MTGPSWRTRLGDMARAVTRVARSSKPPAPLPAPAPASQPRRPYAGDFKGVPKVTYAPVADHDADPGEVVWAWVPYEEDYTQGKDRPVLVIGRDGPYLLALPFTSKDHHRDEAQEARAGRHWFDIGVGAWDRSGRPSEVRLDRVLRLDPAAVRREGATLDQARFEAMAARLHAGPGR